MMRTEKFSDSSQCRFLVDLGKLDGWFGLERGVYLGKNYDLLYYHNHNYLYYYYYYIIFTIGNNLYCLGKGGQLRSEREILWEDASPHDFSYWNNIREDREGSLKIPFDNHSRGLIPNKIYIFFPN